MAKKKRRSYLDNYQRGMNGEFYYTGQFMRFEGTAEERGVVTRFLIGLCIALAALFIGSGLVDGGKLWNTFYVLIPFALEAVFLAIMIYKIIRFAWQKEPVKEYVYKQTVPAFMGMAIAAAIAAVVEAIACVVYIMIAEEVVLRACIIFIVIKVVSAALLVIFRFWFKKFRWTAGQ